MLKNTNEKETYLAPQWGMRVVTVERYIMGNSIQEEEKTEYLDEEDGGNL